MKRVITIGREFGSGGREIGRRIAEKLQIAYYDQEIVTEIAKRTKLSEEYVERITEDRPYMAYPVHAGMSFHTAYYAYTEFDRSLTVFAEQHNMIKELAEKSDCVIVGRCADYILKEKESVPYFRLRRCGKQTETLSGTKPGGRKFIRFQNTEGIYALSIKDGQDITTISADKNGEHVKTTICLSIHRVKMSSRFPKRLPTI